MKIMKENWFNNKRELWTDIKWYYDRLINHNEWDLMDEFTLLYSHYENDLDGKLGYSRSNNDYGNKIRRLFIVCTQHFSSDDIKDLKSGAKTIKDFDKDNIL